MSATEDTQMCTGHKAKSGSSFWRRPDNLVVLIVLGVIILFVLHKRLLRYFSPPPDLQQMFSNIMDITVCNSSDASEVYGVFDVAVFDSFVEEMVWVKESPPLFKGSWLVVMVYEDGREERLIVSPRSRFFVIEDYAHLGYVRLPGKAGDTWRAELKDIVMRGSPKKEANQ